MPEQSQQESVLRRHAATILRAALEAVEPGRLVARELVRHPLEVAGKLQVIAFGKAAVAMARAVDRDRRIGPRVTRGVVVAPRQAGNAPADLPPHYRVYPAGHPAPDAGSVAGARAVRDAVRSAGPGGLLIALVSGGGSALLTLPPPGVSLDDIATVIRLLSESGAPIAQLNAVRKQLDLVKGGRLARDAWPAWTLALILSDVPGDALDVIASGPLAADRSTPEGALAAVRALGPAVPESVLRYLTCGASAGPGPGDECFERVSSLIVGNGATAARAAGQAARELGYAVELVPEPVTGDVGEVARTLSDWVRRRHGSGRACRVSAGEPTVRLRGGGAGGRNQHLALTAAAAISGLPAALIASLATDGVDGPTTAAGGLATGTTAARARTAGYDLADRLEDCDSAPVLAALGDLLVTGPTGTNVADVQLALVGDERPGRDS